MVLYLHTFAAKDPTEKNSKLNISLFFINYLCQCNAESHFKGRAGKGPLDLRLTVPPVWLPPRRSSKYLQVCWGARGSRSAAS